MADEQKPPDAPDPGQQYDILRSTGGIEKSVIVKEIKQINETWHVVFEGDDDPIELMVFEDMIEGKTARPTGGDVLQPGEMPDLELGSRIFETVPGTEEDPLPSSRTWEVIAMTDETITLQVMGVTGSPVERQVPRNTFIKEWKKLTYTQVPEPGAPARAGAPDEKPKRANGGEGGEGDEGDEGDDEYWMKQVGSLAALTALEAEEKGLTKRDKESISRLAQMLDKAGVFGADPATAREVRIRFEASFWEGIKNRSPESRKNTVDGSISYFERYERWDPESQTNIDRLFEGFSAEQVFGLAVPAELALAVNQAITEVSPEEPEPTPATGIQNAQSHLLRLRDGGIISQTVWKAMSTEVSRDFALIDTPEQQDRYERLFAPASLSAWVAAEIDEELFANFSASWTATVVKDATDLSQDQGLVQGDRAAWVRITSNLTKLNPLTGNTMVQDAFVSFKEFYQGKLDEALAMLDAANAETENPELRKDLLEEAKKFAKLVKRMSILDWLDANDESIHVQANAGPYYTQRGVESGKRTRVQYEQLLTRKGSAEDQIETMVNKWVGSLTTTIEAGGISEARYTDLVKLRDGLKDGIFGLQERYEDEGGDMSVREFLDIAGAELISDLVMNTVLAEEVAGKTPLNAIAAAVALKYPEEEAKETVKTTAKQFVDNAVAQLEGRLAEVDPNGREGKALITAIAAIRDKEDQIAADVQASIDADPDSPLTVDQVGNNFLQTIFQESIDKFGVEAFDITEAEAGRAPLGRRDAGPETLLATEELKGITDELRKLALVALLEKSGDLLPGSWLAEIQKIPTTGEISQGIADLIYPNQNVVGNQIDFVDAALTLLDNLLTGLPDQESDEAKRLTAIIRDVRGFDPNDYSIDALIGPRLDESGVPVEGVSITDATRAKLLQLQQDQTAANAKLEQAMTKEGAVDPMARSLAAARDLTRQAKERLDAEQKKLDDMRSAGQAGTFEYQQQEDAVNEAKAQHALRSSKEKGQITAGGRELPPGAGTYAIAAGSSKIMGAEFLSYLQSVGVETQEEKAARQEREQAAWEMRGGPGGLGRTPQEIAASIGALKDPDDPTKPLASAEKARLWQLTMDPEARETEARRRTQEGAQSGREAQILKQIVDQAMREGDRRSEGYLRQIYAGAAREQAATLVGEENLDITGQLGELGKELDLSPEQTREEVEEMQRRKAPFPTEDTTP